MEHNNTNENGKKNPALIAYFVIGSGEKAVWTRIGAAWNHQDGKGANLALQLVPVNGGLAVGDGARIVLRVPSDEKEENGAGA